MKIRTFLAIVPPLQTVRRIADEIVALQQPALDAGWKVAWVPAPNLHLTLKFLGMVPEESVEAILVRLRREFAARSPFEAEIRGLGAFPRASDPKILWAGIEKTNLLAALQQDVEGWMADLGFEREARDFHPHITIGRVRHPGGAPIEPLLAARSSTTFGTLRAAEVVVYESRTHGAGSEYVALGRIPIGKKV